MTTARHVHLLRMPHLRAAHQALGELALAGDPLAARQRVILVPTRQAARELRRTLERARLAGLDQRDQPLACLLPHLLTREGFYQHLHAGLGLDVAPLLSRQERLALLWRASDIAIEEGSRPPFAVRPGLLVEMLALYDGVRRNGRTTGDFERVLVERLEPGAAFDRGAERLLAQTRYLTAAYRAYERSLDEGRLLDEHGLRTLVLERPSLSPITHVVLTVADQAADTDGLWPADFDVLTRLPGLARIDVLATEATLAAGLHARLFERLPGIEGVPAPAFATAEPVLITPPAAEERLHFSSRDREEELRSIARSLRAGSAGGHGQQSDRSPSTAARSSLGETVIVYQRPLPYVYLANRVLDAACVPFSIADTLPLAAEPHVAALDLVFEAVLGGLAREPLVRLLESPLMSWREDGRRLSPRDASVVDAAWRAQGGGEGPEALERLASAAGPGIPSEGPAGVRFRRALQAASAARAELAPLDRERPVSEHFAALADLLRRRESHLVDPGLAERAGRGRQATLGLLDEMAEAYRRRGDRVASFRDAVSLVRRSIEEHTFAPLAEAPGVRLMDARTARYADAAAVWLVGVVEGEWPAGTPRNVFYPASLLRDLGFAAEQDRVPAARAAFRDLVSLARTRVAVSAFQLEEDAIVRPSVLMEDLDEMPLARLEVSPPTPAPPASAAELMRRGCPRVSPLADDVAAWLALRARRSGSDDERFHGAAGPPRPTIPRVTAVERYLDCPFKYFASEVLRLEEEDREFVGLDPRRRGTIVHEVFEAFFRAWSDEEGGAITPATLPRARARFVDVVERAIDALPEADRILERSRLLGSAGAPGLGERVFRLEASRPIRVVERLLEVDLRGTYVLGGDAARAVALRGKADRIDLLADGTFRALDYKTGKAPARRRAIQLAVYALCAEQKLRGYGGRDWTPSEAAYLAFGERHAWVPIMKTPEDRRSLEDGVRRFLAALDDISRGSFPPAPAERRLCRSCAYAAVCRKDYVDRPA